MGNEVFLSQRLQPHPCIPSKFPLSYLRRPSSNMPTAADTMSMVKPTMEPSSGQVNWCNNCKGMNEMKPAGMTVKSSSRTTPLKMFMG